MPLTSMKTDQSRLSLSVLLIAVRILAVALASASGVSHASPAVPSSTRYYLSNKTGNDAWSGTSPERPWRSLEAVRAHDFQPGDKILLHAGERFAGQLSVRSSGAPGRPIEIARYGPGTRPIIDGAGAQGGGYSAAVLIVNQHDIEMRGLEVVNTVARLRAGQATDQAEGILVVNDGGGVLSNFLLADLYIHDIFAKALSSASEDQFNKVKVSGIRFQVTAQQTVARPSYFENVRITGNLVSRTGRFGVQMDDPGPAGAGGADAPSRDAETGFNRDVLIAGNRFVETGGSGVQLAGARRALIDDNDFDRCGSKVVPDRMVGRGSGAWVINSRDIVAQHNRSRHIRGYKDSYGMHVDFGNLNVIYQYNYSEDSEGGFIEILGANHNITWRYNISVNDGFREKEGNTLWFSTWSPGRRRSDGLHIYNNTIFAGAGLTPDLSLTALGAQVWNNIFYAAPDAAIGRELTVDMRGNGLSLRNNLFFGDINPGFMAKSEDSVVGDPKLRSPGLLSPHGYQLLPGSPARGKGAPPPAIEFPEAGKGVLVGITAAAVVDFFGQPIRGNGSPNIGADGTFASD